MSYPWSKEVREGGERVWIADTHAGHTPSVEPALPGAWDCIPSPPKGHSKWGPAHSTATPFPSSRPFFGSPANRGKHQNHRQKQGKRKGPWEPRSKTLPAGANSSTPACLAASTLLWRTLASWFWSILNRLMLTLLYTFVHWLRMNNVNVLVISVIFVLSINAAVTIRLSLLWLNHCYCFHVDCLKNNKIVTFLVIL